MRPSFVYSRALGLELRQATLCHILGEHKLNVPSSCLMNITAIAFILESVKYTFIRFVFVQSGPSPTKAHCQTGLNM